MASLSFLRKALRALLPLVLSTLTGLSLPGCSKATDPNLIPIIELISGPLEGAMVGSAQVVFEWKASDPDGEVTGYCFGMDVEGPATFSVQTSREFTLSSGDHVFKLYAIDNEDARSKTFKRSFTCDFGDTYIGAMIGAPRAAITLFINGCDISGTGEIIETVPPIFGGDGDPPHIQIVGILNGKVIQSMSAIVKIKLNTTPLEPEPTWVSEAAELRFTGELNNAGGILGVFGGETESGIALGGSWIVVKSGK